MDAATLIHAARRRARISQRELARRASTSAAAVNMYESGRRIPGVDTLTRLLAAAGAELRLETPVFVRDHDAERQARELGDVLELADAIPASFVPGLKVPVFARECSEAIDRRTRLDSWHQAGGRAIR